MSTETDQPDPAAIFAGALSLWNTFRAAHEAMPITLSEAYNGADEFMRQVMRVARLFEQWACRHVAFNELGEVWPYLLDERFGDACLESMTGASLVDFDEEECLRVAMQLGLPLLVGNGLPLPVDISVPNPLIESEFRGFRIQTMRANAEGDECSPFTVDDEPFDADFGKPFFTLYGVLEDGIMEDIADRHNYSAALDLARKLAPGVAFPETIIVRPNGRI